MLLDPFLCREQPGSFKKGPSATSAQTFTFFLLLDPFLCRERPGSFKKGPSATSAQTFTFFLVLDPFLCRERPGSFKKGPSATSAQTFTFFLVLDPFLCRERPASSKTGPSAAQLRPSHFPGGGTFFCAVSGLDPSKRGPPSGSTVSVALPDTQAVPVLALSVPCSLRRCYLSVADPVWISFFAPELAEHALYYVRVA